MNGKLPLKSIDVNILTAENLLSSSIKDSKKSRRDSGSIEISSEMTDILSNAILNTPLPKMEKRSSPINTPIMIVEDEEGIISSPMMNDDDVVEEEDPFAIEEEEEDDERVVRRKSQIQLNLSNLTEIIDEELLFRLNYHSRGRLMRMKGVGRARAEYIMERRNDKLFKYFSFSYLRLFLI